ncbi:unnamed protein product, partial [Symbiodinium sp. KB8]
ALPVFEHERYEADDRWLRTFCENLSRIQREKRGFVLQIQQGVVGEKSNMQSQRRKWVRGGTTAEQDLALAVERARKQWEEGLSDEVEMVWEWFEPIEDDRELRIDDKGRLQGRARCTWPNGNVYEGDYQGGSRTAVSTSGSTASGGKGTYTFASGQVEVGFLDEGKDKGRSARCSSAWTARRPASFADVYVPLPCRWPSWFWYSPTKTWPFAYLSVPNRASGHPGTDHVTKADEHRTAEVYNVDGSLPSLCGPSVISAPGESFEAVMLLERRPRLRAFMTDPRRKLEEVQLRLLENQVLAEERCLALRWNQWQEAECSPGYPSDQPVDMSVSPKTEETLTMFQETLLFYMMQAVAEQVMHCPEVMNTLFHLLLSDDTEHILRFDLMCEAGWVESVLFELQ